MLDQVPVLVVERPLGDVLEGGVECAVVRHCFIPFIECDMHFQLSGHYCPASLKRIPLVVNQAVVLIEISPDSVLQG